MFFQRTTLVTSTGPHFLSIEVNESIGCGGVHPYGHRFTLTYDLAKGDLVRWGSYLTKAHAKDVLTTPASESVTKLPAVQSALLEKLFVAGWKDSPGCRVEDVANPTPESVLSLTPFQLSAAPRGGGLSVLPVDLASVAEHCAAPVILDKTGMDALGIPQDVQDALLRSY